MVSIDAGDIHKQANLSGVDNPGNLWLPAAILSNPAFTLGLDHLYAGLGVENKIKLLPSRLYTQYGLESCWKVHSDENNPPGIHKLTAKTSLSGNKTCRFMHDISSAVTVEMLSPTHYEVSMYQVAGSPVWSGQWGPTTWLSGFPAG